MLKVGFVIDSLGVAHTANKATVVYDLEGAFGLPGDFLWLTQVNVPGFQSVKQALGPRFKPFMSRFGRLPFLGEGDVAKPRYA